MSETCDSANTENLTKYNWVSFCQNSGIGSQIDSLIPGWVEVHGVMATLQKKLKMVMILFINN